MTVHLVGAGPGDPALLTVAAAELLRGARVVVYDRPSMDAILALVPGGRGVHCVGRAPGRRALTQIGGQRAADRARRTSGDVVRLKSGDPFVASRGAEEAVGAAAAGIDVRVVPGVSAALAAPAAAGIPLMLRQLSVTATFVDGNDDDEHAEPPDWAALARLGGTLVILTGRGRIRRTAAALIARRPRSGDADRRHQRRRRGPSSRSCAARSRPARPASPARDLRRRPRRRTRPMHIPDGFLTGEAAAARRRHGRGGDRRVPARRAADDARAATSRWPASPPRSSSSATRRWCRSPSARRATCSAGRSRSRCSGRGWAR